MDKVPSVPANCDGSTHVYGPFLHILHTHCSFGNHWELPVWLLITEGILLAAGILPLLIAAVTYAWKLIFRKKFREDEMAASVDYPEADERETLMTMRATKRAYMVLNFVLLLGWLFSLLKGQIGTALLLFIIQLIGGLSFRRQMEHESE